MTAEEEAWNAYPYTKTRYTCPFVEKFSVEIETYYFPDGGHQENVFNLNGSDLRNRIVGKRKNVNFEALEKKLNPFCPFFLYIQDVIDIVKEQLHGNDYVESEDPLLYKSNKTNRGPLTEGWIQEYWDEVCHSSHSNT